MLKTLLKTLGILSSAELWRGGVLVGLMAILAAMEAAGVASIAPFLAVLGNPGIIETNPYLQRAYAALGFTSPQKFLIALAGFSLAVLIFVSALRTVVNFALYRYANMRRHAIGMRLMDRYLKQPYAFFLGRNSSELSKTILSEVDQVIDWAIISILLLFAYALVLIALLALLVAIDPMIALMLSVAIGGIYALLYTGLRGTLNRMGAGRERANSERYRAAAEVLGGIKELKVLGRDRAYVDMFRQPSLRFSSIQATSTALAEIPKYLVEALGFAAVLIVALVLLNRSGGMSDALPLIGLYAYAGYKILPAMHQLYRSFVRLRFITPAVDAIAAELEDVEAQAETVGKLTNRLSFRDRITLENISFCYAGSEIPVFKDVTVSIRAGSITGIIGATGVGKSTLVDLLLGLLKPTTGRVLVDGVPLTPEARRAWNNNVGYVPQHIFLTDDSIARNVAFGVENSAIDRAAVEKACRLAQVHDFITQSLPKGYDTVIGERGVRLSGGQRQRLGIARALYHDPQIVILDEAMNALDQDTELAVLGAVQALAPAKTIVMITHRLATAEVCDQVLTVERGRVTETTGEELRRQA
jgi:ABC-type multidrug transport system fused ATPase/permease subunit